MKIAVLIGGILYGRQKSLLEGIEDYAKKKRVHIYVFTCSSGMYRINDHFEGEFQIYDLPDFNEYDGIIFMPDTIQNVAIIKNLQKQIKVSGVPAICIDAKISGIPCYEIDNQKAMYQMVKHIIGKHNRFPVMYLNGPMENVESNKRRTGFLQCMDYEAYYEEKDYYIYHGNFWTNSGKEAIARFYEDHGEYPKVVICANDHMACGVLDGLKEAGCRVPEDVIVTGFDNTREAAHYVPRLTSLEKPLYQMGYEACQTLVTNRHNIKDKLFEVTYFFSESCGCKKNDVSDSREFGLHMLKEKSDSVSQIENINNMLADMNDIESLNEFTEQMKQFVEKMNFPYFALCLCEENELIGALNFNGKKYSVASDEETSYTATLQATILYKNGEFFPQEEITRQQLLPDSFTSKEEGSVFVVVPLHFRKHCMGYCVLGNSNFPMETVQFYTWIMNMGTALEHIRKQSLMQQMLLRLNKMSCYDMMTGVYNRIGFYAAAEKMIVECRKKQMDMVLFFLDIDGLKYVNDNYGHEEGDYYISSVAKACQNVVKDYGIAMRYGGDEFVLLFPNDEIEYQQIENQINEEIVLAKKQAEKEYPMGVSIGHYITNDEKEVKLDLLLELADKEMYERKRIKKRK